MGKKFSELERTSSLNNGDLFAVAQVDAQAQTGYKSKSTETSTVAQKLLKGIEFPTDLDTSDKTIIGAINEVAETLEGLYPIGNASGPVANFSTEFARPLEALKVGIVATQEAGTPTPSTPKAISGWSNAKITKCGKNLIDNNDIYTYGKWKDDLVAVGDFPTNSSNRGYSLPTKSGETYTISFGIDANNIPTYVYLCKSDGETSSRIAYITSGSSLMNRTYTFTADENLYYLQSGSMATEENFNVQTAKFGYVQLEVGSSASTYESFNSNTEVINLGGTYYGGRLTLDKDGHRQFEVTHKSLDWSALNFRRSNNSGIWTNYLFFASVSDMKYVYTQISDIYGIQLTGDIGNIDNYKFRTSFSGSIPYIYFRNDDYTDVETFTTAMLNHQLVYELATPYTIDLPDGSPIETLIGVNNIFADTGDILECKYKDTIQHYIDTQIAATQALVLNS